MIAFISLLIPFFCSYQFLSSSKISIFHTAPNILALKSELRNSILDTLITNGVGREGDINLMILIYFNLMRRFVSDELFPLWFLKGWEDGMVGMKKGAKRLLFIPPACAAGSEGVIGWSHSTDSIRVFEVEIRRVSEIVLCLMSSHCQLTS